MQATGLEEQRVRAARNQSFFREVNERIDELRPSSSFVEFVCECTLQACTERISLTLEEYEDVRVDSNRFVVIPGHELAEVETVVAEHDRYLVVAKLGAGAEVAEQLDPRRAASS